MNIVGKVINGYLFEEALGSGSFGAVYRVSKENKRFAAKVLSETYILAEFKNENNRIRREIDVLKQVTGHNLIKYEEDFYFENEFGVKEYIIIMEYFEGKTLKEYLQLEKNIDVLIEVFIKVLQGVNELHNTIINNEGIIHRDLKPENIMIDENQNVKIIDYGLSKIIDFSSITSTGVTIGSPLYMSPQQLKDGKNIDYRADIYSLGIILYQMLTSNMPYEATNIQELAIKIMNDPIIPPKRYNPNINDNIERIIFKATAKELFARFQTIDEFIKAFGVNDVQEEIRFLGKYYAWVYREADVTINFEKENIADIIYPIHAKDWVKTLYKHFEKNEFKNVIIDPSTQRLSYTVFANTKGLLNLQYAPQDGVISLDYLRNPAKRNQYINNWYNTVSMCKKLILPYHYISNTDYSGDKIEDWIKINIQLINESVRIVDSDKEKYAMISIDINNLFYQEKNILAYFINVDVDGFIVQVSGMRKLNVPLLKSYLNFMVNLQKHTNKPVIALRVPISLGLTLISKGIHGFSLGLAGIDYFDEENIKEDKDSYQLYSRYYFPQLLSFLPYPCKDSFVFEQLYNYFDKCDCIWCKDKPAIEISKGNKSIQLHHWQLMLNEVEQINEYKGNKIEYISKRIEDAILAFDSIPNEIMSSQKTNDYYKLLKNIQNVI